MAIDYRGRKYRCLMDLLKSYGINYTDYKLKNKIGWSIDEIILGSPKTFRISDDGFVYDHKCNRYDSEEAMLQSYGLTYGAFHGRLKRGYDLEHALTTPLVRTVSIDDRKVEKLLDDVTGYDIVKALAAYYEKELPSEDTLEKLKHKHADIKLKDSFSGAMKRGTVPKPVFDHYGTWYPSCAKMCEAWHITEKLYRMRIYKNKWPMKYALEIENGCKKFYDHEGNVYSSIAMMCRAYGISKEDFQIRIDAGWSLADALCS